MATTAAYSADVLMSGGGDANHQQWEYAVPVRHDSVNRRSKSRSSHDSANRKSRDRSSKESRSSSVSRSRQTNIHELNSSRGRRDPSLGRRGSETGSSRGVYGHESGSRSVGNVRESGEGVMHGPPNEAKWIHRDKLAKIESEELHQAALLFHRRTGESRPSRGRNQSGVSGSSVNTPPTEHTEPWPNMYEGQRTSSPVPLDRNGTTMEDAVPDECRHWDLRKPEEIAADEMMDDGASGFYRNPALRKSSSRIPIPRASPAPILSEQSGREFSRFRAPTAGEDDAASGSMPRRASEPMAMDSDASTPPNGSRPNSRGAQATMQNASGGSRKPGVKGTTGSSTNRKTSAPPATTRQKTPKSRTTSGTTQRPTTRSGESRPTTAANRPEGDPPWLATMYKPDPRIPPDQQIIPTHARRVQQEQWEKEGKTPTTYDRGFAPLAITPDGASRPENNEKSEKSPLEEPKPMLDGNTWPLAPSKSPDPPRPSTGTAYSPMPRVQEPPSASLTPKWSPPVVTAQEPPSPKEEKGGCGCCIVM